MPEYNTRVKLPEDKRADLSDKCETHTHTRTHTHGQNLSVCFSQLMTRRLGEKRTRPRSSEAQHIQLTHCCSDEDEEEEEELLLLYLYKDEDVQNENELHC